MKASLPAAEAPVIPVRVWDLPTRLFHWALAASVVGAVASAKIGGNAMVWHFRFGYCVLALLAFRVVWGLIGGRWSRFSSFVRGPGTLWRYLRGRTSADEHLDVGHNPLGALSVLAMLGVLAAQVATGLLADDEIASTGPLARFVSSATSGLATYWHKDWGQWLIIGLALLHVLAIVAYALRGRALLPAMLGGDRALAPGTPASADGLRERLVAAVVLAACAGAVAWIVSLGA
ncbi:MAG: cytochrome b/b6 domain-containing protein [Ideonella sp.]|jgi:cytochrome b|nr:cytochrome b/b6 domain-containing protein [Ideonella sp.]